MNLMRICFLALVLLLMGGDVMAQKKDKKKKDPKTTEIPQNKTMNQLDSASYSLAVLIAQNLKQQGLDTLNYDLFIKGITDVIENRNLDISEADARNYANAYLQSAVQRKAQKNLEDGRKFLEQNKNAPGVITTTSGLQYMVLKQGSGPKPSSLQTKVTAHYHGTLTDGTVFDSSVKRNQPFQTQVGGVIKAWQEALMLMNVGTKLKIFCPSELAYGQRGSGPVIGPNMVLIFEMELLSIDN